MTLDRFSYRYLLLLFHRIAKRIVKIEHLKNEKAREAEITLLSGRGKFGYPGSERKASSREQAVHPGEASGPSGRLVSSGAVP